MHVCGPGISDIHQGRGIFFNFSDFLFSSQQALNEQKESAEFNRFLIIDS
jgi:hypothetical protein